MEASSKSRSIRLKIFRKPRERPSFGNAFVNAGTSCEAGARVTKITEPGVCAFAPSTLHGRHVATRRVVMDEVVGWLDFYHARRLRSILDHASPMTFEKNRDAIQWGQAA
ncbi:transposase domain protein [Burkholderia pseudomallei]|nr:transposase domain protein [Burkholderia pseudomallei]